MASVIDGKSMADGILSDVAVRVASLVEATGKRPTLAVILVGEDPASHVYVGRKLAAARRAGVASLEMQHPAAITQVELLDEIDQLNADRNVHGILVQLPLPAHIDPLAVLDRIAPGKDVDGFHPVNVGRLSTGKAGLVPCTPLACMLLLESVIDDFRGKNAVVIGKSNIVGKPVALMLLERECTVSVTHIHTQDLPRIVSRGDIVVVATGTPGLVRGGWVKPGAVVIDVGINRVWSDDGKARIVGDVVTGEMTHAAAITPVPGGVGPMTVACLLMNTILAAEAVSG